MTGLASLLVALGSGVAGGGLSLVSRLPGWTGSSVPVPAHSLVLIFYAAIPALFAGFGTLLVPWLVGAADSAFPAVGRLGLLAMVSSLLMLLVGQFSWTTPCVIVAVNLAALSSLLNAADLVITILNERADRSARLSLFVWSQLIGAGFLLCAVPIMAASVTMRLGHGVPTISAFVQVLPAAFTLMTIPSLGMMAEIVCGLTQRALPGHRWIVLAMAVLAVAGFMGWALPLLRQEKAPSPIAPFVMTGLILPNLVLAVGAIRALRLSRHFNLLLTPPGLFTAGYVLTIAEGPLIAVFSPAGHDPLSIAFGLALCAGFTWWVPRLTGLLLPPVIGSLQAGMLVGGAMLFVLPYGTAHVLAAAMVSVSIILCAVVGAAMLLQLQGGRWLGWVEAGRNWVGVGQGGAR